MSGVKFSSWSGDLLSTLNKEEILTIVPTLALGVLIGWYIGLGL